MSYSPEIAPLAQRQLAAWQAIAEGFPITLWRRETGMHLICLNCGMTIIPLDDGKDGYFVSLEVLQAATVAHLRNVHRELDPEGNPDVSVHQRWHPHP